MKIAGGTALQATIQNQLAHDIRNCRDRLGLANLIRISVALIHKKSRQLGEAVGLSFFRLSGLATGLGSYRSGRKAGKLNAYIGLVSPLLQKFHENSKKISNSALSFISR